MNTAYDWIQLLEMTPHPDGGYYKETYRSTDTIDQVGLSARYDGPRPAGTGIYYLLSEEAVNYLHRLKSDEMWHFYAGDPLLLHLFQPMGEVQQIRLGADPEKGEVFQAVVERDCWFGASLVRSEGYALVGCTVAPGFDFADLEMADPETLVDQFPEHTNLILRLTKKS